MAGSPPGLGTDDPNRVDTMNDASWRVLGHADNLGLAVHGAGTVMARFGWFDAIRIEAVVRGL